MNEIANASSIRGGMIPAENGQRLSLLNYDLLDDGEEVVGSSQWLVTQQMRLVRATGVEKSKGN